MGASNWGHNLAHQKFFQNSNRSRTQLRYSKKPGDLAHRNGYAGVTSHFAVRDPNGWPPENWGMTIVKPSKHIFIQRTGGRDLGCDLWKKMTSNYNFLQWFGLIDIFDGSQDYNGVSSSEDYDVSKPQLSSEKQRVHAWLCPWGQSFRGDILPLARILKLTKKQQPGWAVQKLLENPIIFASLLKMVGLSK